MIFEIRRGQTVLVLLVFFWAHEGLKMRDREWGEKKTLILQVCVCVCVCQFERSQERKKMLMEASWMSHFLQNVKKNWGRSVPFLNIQNVRSVVSLIKHRIMKGSKILFFVFVFGEKGGRVKKKSKSKQYLVSSWCDSMRQNYLVE